MDGILKSRKYSEWHALAPSCVLQGLWLYRVQQPRPLINASPSEGTLLCLVTPCYVAHYYIRWWRQKI